MVNLEETARLIMLKLKLLKIERPAEMPLWQDCVWQRKACGKINCRFCGLNIQMQSELMVEEALEKTEIGKKVAKEIAEEEIEDTSYFDDDPVNRGGFSIAASRKFEAEDEENFDGPGWERFPLVKKLTAWNDNLLKIHEQAFNAGSSWIKDEAADELFWYFNYLPVKTGRLMSDRRDLDKGRWDAEWDYDFTRYILAQCILRSDRAFFELEKVEGVPEDLRNLHQQMLIFAEEIVEI